MYHYIQKNETNNMQIDSSNQYFKLIFDTDIFVLSNLFKKNADYNFFLIIIISSDLEWIYQSATYFLSSFRLFVLIKT